MLTIPHSNPTHESDQQHPPIEAEDLDAFLDGVELVDGVESAQDHIDAEMMIGRDGDSSEVRGTVREVFASMKEGEQKQVKSCPLCPGKPLPKGESVVVRRTAHSLIVTIWGEHGHAGEKQTKGGQTVSNHRWSEPLPAFSRGDHVELGRDLAKHLHPSGKRLYSSHTDRYGLRVYDAAARTGACPSAGAWRSVDPRSVERKASAYAGRRVVTGEGEKQKVRDISLKANDLKGIVRVCENELHEDGDVFDSPWVGFLNGNYNPNLPEIHSFDEPAAHHRVLAERVLPFRFSSDARSERWEKFLIEAIPDEGARLFLQEFVGASIHGKAAEWQVHALLVGRPHTGKSTFLNVISALFPPGATSAAAPSGWVTTFGLTALMNSLVNVVPELNVDELRKETALMRRVLSHDAVQIERKYQDPVMVHVKAGHLYACNELPASGDVTGGLFRRFRIVEFPRIFVSDDAFAASLTSAGTLTAIYAWALEGYRRRVRNGVYTTPGTHAEHLDEWKAKSDSVFAWAQVFLVRDETQRGYSGSLFEKYKAWCKDNGFEAKNSTNFRISMGREYLPNGKKPKDAKGFYYPVRYVGGPVPVSDPGVLDLFPTVEQQIVTAWEKQDTKALAALAAAHPAVARRILLGREGLN